MLLRGKHGALVISRAGQIGEEHGANVRFSIVSGVFIVRVGKNCKFVICLPRKAALPFLSELHRALTDAGHSTELLCVIDPV